MVSEKLRQTIIKEYNSKCQYCLCGDANHVDHIVPKAKGGSDDPGNLILACAPCNIRKSDLELPEAYIGLLLAIAGSKREKILKLVEKAENKAPREKKAILLPVFDSAGTTEELVLKVRDEENQLTTRALSDSDVIFLANWALAGTVTVSRNSPEDIFAKETVKGEVCSNQLSACQILTCTFERANGLYTENESTYNGSPSDYFVDFLKQEIRSRKIKHPFSDHSNPKLRALTAVPAAAPI